MRGVLGGGRMRENSAARECRGDCFVGRATITFVFRESSWTIDCGVISLPRSRNCQKDLFPQYAVERTAGFGREENDVGKVWRIVFDNNGALRFG
jgi:hypothetical protein